jgi:hypothetical protein
MRQKGVVCGGLAERLGHIQGRHPARYPGNKYTPLFMASPETERIYLILTVVPVRTG